MVHSADIRPKQCEASYPKVNLPTCLNAPESYRMPDKPNLRPDHAIYKAKYYRFSVTNTKILSLFLGKKILTLPQILSYPFFCNMEHFAHEHIFDSACGAFQIPGAVIAAGNATGEFKYIKAFGKTVDDNKLSIDNVMLLGGCTNLMTTVAALQLVSQGKVELDQDIEGILPELSDLDVLGGFATDGHPKFTKKHRRLTLRYASSITMFRI